MNGQKWVRLHLRGEYSRWVPAYEGFVAPGGDIGPPSVANGFEGAAAAP
jgi:hypothetical protein